MCKPEENETPKQYIFRMKTYPEKWIENVNINKTSEGLKELIVKEQLVRSYPKDLSVFINERETTDLKYVAKIANQYLVTHGKQLYTALNHDDIKPFNDETDTDRQTIKCFNCSKVGHKDAGCRSKKSVVMLKCTYCQKLGHTEKECYSKNKKKVASVIVQEDERVGEQQSENSEYTAGCVISKNKKSDFGNVHEKNKIFYGRWKVKASRWK